ncbi:uncharacterized protein MONOS_10304 [Monocercomonoides exilis]|uniref:uncharacterized protein n=1 Tax=Monocercomonoides exilis TaxID=2049356 RepID=UPI00355973C4|nr:hypothetical protein MONOS_10304 [Monocercomonoides exilis]|eukprot:MONOS_10304.1-p1 / transcript=MONOS_10304.1 / gene=MONOS_10304 / organism=Monocercomonoides_exilis_PA203 / gene_product=unspecified product / transcript_product=unspecified product / location=Mono_scaffold00463:786-5776(+) / protein_length=1640 / sequence_SO=supercontig / SO=protein_coding / is_pseudo=false
MYLFAITLLFSIFGEEDDCTFKKKELYRIDRVVKCLQHLPYEKGKGETADTMKTVRSYIDCYAYRDIMINPPSPFAGYDILAELKRIENTDYANGLDFHLAIANAFNRLEDAHANYIFPCSSLFAYIFPFKFVFEVPNPTKPAEIVVKIAESLVNGATKKFIDEGGINITGKEVVKLNLPDLDDSVNLKPEEAIAKWADKFVKSSRTPAAKLAYALTQDEFVVRGLSSYPIPEGEIGITIKTDNGEQTVNVPFYGLSNADITDVNDMLSTKCPSQERIQSNNMTEQTNGEQSLFEIEEKHFQSVMNAHKDDPLFQQIFENIWKSQELRKVFSKNSKIFRSSEKLLLPFEKEMRRKVEKIISEQFALSDKRKSCRRNLSFKERVSEKIRKLKTNSNNDQKIPVNYTSNEEKPQLKILKNTSHVIAGVIDAYKVGYLFVGTFELVTTEEIVEWLSGIINGITYIKDHAYKLVVDLRTNGGGLFTFSDWLFKFLFPEEYPIFPTNTVVASEYSKRHLKLISQSPFNFITEPMTQELINDVWEKPKKTVPVIDEDGQERSQDWVYRFVEDYERALQSILQDVPLSYRNVRMFAPSDIMFLTDGTCGSACGRLLKHVKEKKLGKVVGLGGVLSGSSIPFDIASFAGSSVIDTNVVERNRPQSRAMNENTQFQNVTNENVFPYPGKVPRLSTNIRISLIAAYSHDWNTPDELLEFKIIEPDEIFPIYADLINGFNPEGIVKTVAQVKSSFDKCYDWEVKDNYACSIPSGNEHAVFGNPCASGSFNENQCKLSRCERGYYLNKEGKCKKRPYMGPSEYHVDDTICKFPQMEPGRADRFIDCLKQLPYDKNEAAKTLKSIRGYLDMYAYRDIMANPPAPFKSDKFDILTELDRIEKTEYTSGLDFHNAIGLAFSKMKDSVSIYQFPCSQPFAFALPYNFKFEVPDPSKPDEIIVKLVELLPLVTQVYEKDIGRSFKERIVTKITMDDLAEVANEKPEVTIARWCDENIPFSKSPAARLNYGLEKHFAIRSLTSYAVMDGSVKVTLKKDDGGTETIPLYWYGMSTSEISSSGVLYDNFCKAASSTSNDEKGWKTTDEKGTKQLQKLLQSTKMHQKKLIDEYKLSVNMSKEQIKMQDEAEIRKIREKYANDTQFINVFEKFITNKPLRAMLAKDRILHQPLEHLLPPAVQELHKLMEEENQKMAAESKRKQSRSNDAAEVKEIGEIPNVIHGVVIPGWKIGYCSIKSFSVSAEEDFSKFVQIVVNVVQEAKNNNFKMVFDVRGNGGGSSILSSIVYHLLFSETFPLNSRYKYVRAKPSDAFVATLADGETSLFTDYETLDVIDKVANIPTTEKKTIVDGKERFQTWSGSFAINYDRLLYSFIDGLIPSSLYGKNLFDPNDLLFVTDGECAAACSLFLKQVKESQLAKVVGVGGVLTRKDVGFDIASSGANSVLSPSILKELKCETETTEDWPSQFPRQNTDVTLAVLAGYSSDWKTPDEQLEFKVIEPDVVYPYYPSLEEARNANGYLTLLANVKKYFDVCYGWQVKVNGSCAVPDTDANAVYGNPCKEGKFADTCVFARCASGYYRYKDSKCVKSPVMTQLTKEENQPTKKKLSVGAIVAISVSVPVFVIVIVIIIIICVCKKKNKYAL